MLTVCLTDVIKTRVQTWDLAPARNTAASQTQPLLSSGASAQTRNAIMDRPHTLNIAKDAYRAEGVSVFFRGLGICSVRAFVVNAVQWAVSSTLLRSPSGVKRPLTETLKVYEWMMKALAS